jgi:hypothetical protein
MSTRNARRVTSSVGSNKMSSVNRKRGEWEGAWKWAAIARQRQMRVRRAATGWMIRIEDSDFRGPEGRLKSSPVLLISSA